MVVVGGWVLGGFDFGLVVGGVVVCFLVFELVCVELLCFVFVGEDWEVGFFCSLGVRRWEVYLGV